MAAFSKGDTPATLPESAVKVVGQERRNVRQGGRHWIEFEFQFDDPNRARRDYRTTFRVDPKTRLPLDMTEEFSSAGKRESRTFVFDYPAEGPRDIYAQGAPRDADDVELRSQPNPQRADDLATLAKLAGGHALKLDQLVWSKPPIKPPSDPKRPYFVVGPLPVP